MHILCIIPARGGSKGIPGKNIYNLNGKPLLAYSVELAKRIPQIDRVVVSSDDDDILAVAERAGAEVVKRPAELATDAAPTLGAVHHVLETYKKEGYSPDYVVLFQPTSPLRKEETVVRAIETFLKEGEGFDSLMPLAKTSSKVGTIENNQFVPSYAPGAQRQALAKLYFDCGAVYVFRPECILRGTLFGERIFGFPVEWPETIDIDTMADMELTSMIMSNNK